MINFWNALNTVEVQFGLESTDVSQRCVDVLGGVISTYKSDIKRKLQTLGFPRDILEDYREYYREFAVFSGTSWQFWIQENLHPASRW
jgi:hypothetical protein